MPYPASLRTFLASLLALTLVACGDDDSPADDTDAGTQPDAGAIDAALADASEPVEDPLFVLHSAVQSTEGRTNYFTAVSSLAEVADIDYSSSIELPGRARLYAEPGIGFFAIGDGEDTSVTRYTLNDDGTFEEGARLSFQPFGVTSMGAQAVLFVSPTRAYYKDAGQAQIIVWNPTSMEVDEVIELPAELIRDGRVTGFSAWASRPGEAYFAVGWTTLEYDRVDAGSALVRIDTTTNAFTVTNDSRCRDLNKTGVVGDSLYFFSGVINGFGHAVYPDDGGQQDCMLRVLPGQNVFDASYAGTISSALGEDEIGTVIAVTGDGRAWAQVVDTTVAPSTPGSTYNEWYAAGWRWVSLDLATVGDLVRIAGEPGAYSGFTVVDGTRFFVSQTEADYSETTLLDLSSGTPAPGITFPGFALDVARAR
ncbi:hypothetical protein [Sandaracinus amylolyticus]|uniref:Uncharacterized protein n=1 Tax=Sandaracinus amylolyticus TaxID=927083 RepID=A0A0F6W845_9BACT|nr:hypothetical protein [Sandaracinus amylolyticus]AKF09900.1 Hypothetical protein DB32_007049 [Sandaracinus amylolyticus]